MNATPPGGNAPRLPYWWADFSHAVIAERGCATRIATRLEISLATLRLRLTLLRRRGIARTARLTSGARSGRHETLNYVRLRNLERKNIETFEQSCLDDDAVREAVLITGVYDYALTAEHATAAAARVWADQLRGRPEVLRVDQKPLSRRFGHGVIVLRW